MKKYVSTLMALVLAGASAFANAESVTLDITDGVADIAQSFAAGNKFHAFSDEFHFTTTGLSGVEAIVFSFDDVPGVAFSHVDLFKAVNPGSDVKVLAGSFDPVGGLWNVSGTGLTAGSYFLKVQGQVVIDDAATYSGNVSILAVPEADTYAMLLAGLGLVGVVARRRKAVAA
jgi:hypothetical protein